MRDMPAEAGSRTESELLMGRKLRVRKRRYLYISIYLHCIGERVGEA